MAERPDFTPDQRAGLECARPIFEPARYPQCTVVTARDPANWGPAKTIGLAVQERGIHITDRAALDDFSAEVNRNGGIDVLANALAKS